MKPAKREVFRLHGYPAKDARRALRRARRRQ